MTFLSLAKGDPAARALLGNAIKARYGVRPVPLSSLRLELSAQARGPLGLPTKRLIQVRYVETTHRRWDQTEKLFGFDFKHMTESYDGGTLYKREGATAVSINEPKVLQGMRNQLWLELAVFLTPLTEEGVVLKISDPATLQASRSAATQETATLHFNADQSLASAEAVCYHPVRQAAVRLTIRPADGLRAFDGFAVPVTLVYQWDNEPGTPLVIINAEANPKIPLTEFSIG